MCRGILTNPNPIYTQIALSHKYKTKEPRVHKCQIQIPNIKCELRTNQRESHKSNPKVATHQERANLQTAEPKSSGNIPLSLFQIATHKYQITNPRDQASLSLSLSLSLSFSVVALHLHRRLQSASISKTKKD